MTNLEKYNSVFQSVFKAGDEQLGADFRADQVAKWDSIAHLSLITGIEDAFDIMFDPPDILDFRSYDKGKSILAKYDVQV